MKIITLKSLAMLAMAMLLTGCNDNGSENNNGGNPAPNAPPIANPDAGNLYKHRSLVINVLQNDTDAENGVLTLDRLTTPQQGGTVVILNNTSVEYTHHALNFTGVDRFDYFIKDDFGNEAQATVTLTVLDNLPPVVVNDEYVVDNTQPLNLPLLENDSDPESEQLRIIRWTIPPTGQGSLQRVSDSVLRYTPDAGYVGTLSFGYTVTDPSDNYVSATFVLHVQQPVVKIRDLDLTPAESGTQDNSLITYIADVTGTDTDSKFGKLTPLGDMNKDGIADMMLQVTKAGVRDGNTQDYFYSLWGTSTNTFGTSLTLTDLLVENGGEGNRGQMLYAEPSIGNEMQVSNVDMNNDQLLDQVHFTDGHVRIQFGSGSVVNPEINLNTAASVTYERNYTTDKFNLHTAAVFDFNGDNNQDIVLSGYALEGCPPNGSVCKSINQMRIWFGPFTTTTSNPYTWQLDGINGLQINGFVVAIDESSPAGLELTNLDFDNDGHQDLIIGGADDVDALRPNTSRGQVYVLWGGQSNFPATFDISQLSSTTATLAGLTIGTSSAELFNIGTQLTPAGDVNGDGLQDLLITHGIGQQTAKAQVSLLLGQSNWKADADRAFDLNDLVANNALGSLTSLSEPGVGLTKYFFSVSALDINGDNYSDIVIQGAAGVKQIKVILGRTTIMPSPFYVIGVNQTWPILTLSLSDVKSGPAAAASDINNDGFDDLFIVRNLANKRDGFIVYGGLYFGL